MNKIERPYPHPAVIYLSLLIMVILASWIGSIYESRNANLNGETLLYSLLNAQGLRWLIKTPATALAYTPIGNALLIFAGTGIGVRSGWFRAWRTFFSTCRFNAFSRKEKSAFIIALFTLIVFFILLSYGVLGPNNVLLNPSGGVFKSPITQGFIFLLFLATALPSTVYGLASDRFKKNQELVKGFTFLISQYASYFLTLFTASLLITAIEYSNIDHLIGLGDKGLFWLKIALYWLPLPEILYFEKNKTKR